MDASAGLSPAGIRPSAPQPIWCSPGCSERPEADVSASPPTGGYVAQAMPSTVPPFSVLDLAPICEGGAAAQTLRNSVDLARQAERLGYLRYWLAEHHNMPGIASSATSVVIGHIAAG